MARITEKKKIIHEPKTYEIFLCLAGYPNYSKLLLENSPDKPYSRFLRWLLEVNYLKDNPEKITVKRLAADFGSDTTKVTKWIPLIYQDILELNNEKPELFQTDGIKVTLYFKYYDDSGFFNMTLPVMPREYETFKFYFMKAELGIDYFWVKKVEHSIFDFESEICIWLEGGFVNKYREFAFEKISFHEKIGVMAEYDLHRFEIDKIIKSWIRL